MYSALLKAALLKRGSRVKGKGQGKGQGSRVRVKGKCQEQGSRVRVAILKDGQDFLVLFVPDIQVFEFFFYHGLGSQAGVVDINHAFHLYYKCCMWIEFQSISI